MRRAVARGIVVVVLAALAACGGSEEAPAPAEPAPADPAPAEVAGPDVCSNDDGALEAAFVFILSPRSGERVESGFTVTGCSRTFESTVLWRLVDREGDEIAAGFAMGGGVDGPGPFSFTVDYPLSERQIGHLEVFEEDVSGGEGFPPPRNVVPLVLLPAPAG